MAFTYTRPTSTNVPSMIWNEQTGQWENNPEYFNQPINMLLLGGQSTAYVPWLPPPLADIWQQVWDETGDPYLAVEAVRQSPLYDQYFPGNRRDDGSLRYDEQTYLSTVEGYEDALLSVNVNPDLFRTRFADLIAGNVDANEFARRVDSVADRVLVQAPAIREAYVQYYGDGAYDLTDAAILAGVLDPNLNDAILDKRITTAEITGEARLRDFGIDFDVSQRIYERGLGRQQASEVFAEAATSLPILDVLAKRHNDPDDDFDINEFLSAAIFDDVEGRRRIRRLLAQERSMFSGPTGFSTTGRAITGLRPI